MASSLLGVIRRCTNKRSEKRLARRNSAKSDAALEHRILIGGVE
jgi:hypothetical protein